MTQQGVSACAHESARKRVPIGIAIDPEFLELLPRLGARPEDIVFLGGSRAEGWGNEGSDFDYYALCSNHTGIVTNAGYFLPGLSERVKVSYVAVGSRRLECQFWLIEDVLALSTALRSHDLRPLVEFWSKQLELIHRIRTGIPVQGAAEFSRIRDFIDFAAFEEYLAKFNLRAHEAYYHDAVVALSLEKLENAALMAQLSVEHILDAYLALHGETNPQPKWRYERLLRAEGSQEGLVSRYLDTLSKPPTGDRTRLRQHLLEILHLGETLNVCVQLNWQYRDLCLNSNSAVPPTGCGRLWRLPSIKLKRRLNGTLVLVDFNGTTYQINETAAIIWAKAEGPDPRPTIAHLLKQHFGLTDATAWATVSSYVSQLADRNLVSWT